MVKSFGLPAVIGSLFLLTMATGCAEKVDTSACQACASNASRVDAAASRAEAAAQKAEAVFSKTVRK
jgi:hypothetical protein